MKSSSWNDVSTLDVGPSRLGYRRVGSGPDVLFVHGWPLHGETWRDVVPHLADRFTCHVVDLPGTGRSVWTDASPIGFGGHARAVLRAVELLGLDRLALVAHDSGGCVARLCAAELGDRVWGAVLGDTEIAGYRPPLLEAMVGLSKLPGGKRLMALSMRSRAIRRSPLGFGSCFDDLDLVDGDFFRHFVAPLRDPRVAAGQQRLVESFEWSFIDRMAETHARITAPVALIWGDRDPWFPIEKARAMTPQFAGGAVLHAMRGKLFVHEERPAEWAAIAGGFLDERAPGARRAA